MELKHSNKKQEILEAEKSDLKKEVADLKSEILALNTDNTSLQSELHEKKSSVSKKKGFMVEEYLTFWQLRSLLYIQLWWWSDGWFGFFELKKEYLTNLSLFESEKKKPVLFCFQNPMQGCFL